MFTLEITEIWPGQTGTAVTADWFEITNTGTAPWSSGSDPVLSYDDGSNDPNARTEISGITEIAPGESVIVVIGTAADADAFKTAWGPAIGPVEVGWADGDDLATTGESVTLLQTV